jgi:hypothetical protein
MKNGCSAVLFIAILACNGQPANGIGAGSDSNVVAGKSSATEAAGAGDCGNSLLFHKGAVVYTNSYDGQGKLTSKSVSTVTKTYDEGGMSVAEVEMKGVDEKDATKAPMTAKYKCDGKQLYVDLSGLMPGGNTQQSKLETSGMLFPFKLSAGETLPDASHSISMERGGKTMSITSHIKERKVEAKESLTTPAGTFECYKISSVIETDMPGLDEKSKQIMEETKKRMGKNRMIIWYSSDITIFKMELYMGERLLVRSEITAIKK